MHKESGLAASRVIGDVIGRDRERASLREFLSGGDRAPSLMVLEGEPGIGKTFLWQEGVRLARERGYRVLLARPAESEVQLSFAALGDLLEDVSAEVMGLLPTLRRRALEAALLLGEAEGPPPDPRAVALGVLGVLRLLAASDPVLLAVDDVQWLDKPSARALEFAIRRSSAAVQV